MVVGIGLLDMVAAQTATPPDIEATVTVGPIWTGVVSPEG